MPSYLRCQGRLGNPTLPRPLVGPKLRPVNQESDEPQTPTGQELDKLRAQGVADRELISSLAAEGVISRELVASLAAEGVSDRKEIEEIKAALITSRRIGAAIGILMATKRVTEDEAFIALRDASKRSNRKLREVADEVCATGDTTAITGS